MDGILNCAELKEFQKNGYLILKNLFKPEECQVLRDECHSLVDDFDPSKHPKSVFSTGEDQTSDEYFMTSADKIRFFFENNVFNSDGNLSVEKHLSLNKIGHALHALNTEFKKVTFDPRIQNVAKALGLKKPAICQSMYIFKQAKTGGEVVAHQDATFLHTTPVNVFGIWIALEDCTTENGCLWFVPGSHKDGVKKRFVRDPSVSEFATKLIGPELEYDMAQFVPEEVKAGTAVVIHGQVVHYSAPNHSSKSRNIYTFHIVDQHNTEWSKENWLQPTDSLPFVPLFSK